LIVIHETGFCQDGAPILILTDHCPFDVLLGLDPSIYRRAKDYNIAKLNYGCVAGDARVKPEQDDVRQSMVKMGTADARMPNYFATIV
jgi:hypothetical protein